MKTKQYSVELVTEVAKDMVYSKDFMTLSDQIMVLAKQHHKWFKLKGQVEWTVSDAAFLLSAVYSQEKDNFPLEMFNEFVVELYNSYNTINIFIERDDSTFQQYGRTEDLEQSKEIDKKIRKILDDNDIPYYKVKAGKKTVKQIYSIVKSINKQ